MIKSVSVLSVLLLAGTAWAGGTTLKSNVAPLADTCVAGICDYYSPLVCATNADCDPLGSLSPKSKVSITGAGRVKVQLKDVLDSAGMPASGNYHLYLYLFGQTDVTVVDIEVPVDAGKGKADADLSTLLPPAGEATAPGLAFLLSPASVPALCPSGNDAASLTARSIDADCDGDGMAVVGVASGGKSSTKSNLVSIADTCAAGMCDFYPLACATNADCDPYGSASPKSKIQISGTGRVKVQLKDVVDSAGMDASGNYHVLLQAIGQSAGTIVDIEVPVDGGKGKADVELGTLMPPAGEAVGIAVYVTTYLIGPATVPANCPSGNDAPNLTGRVGDIGCDGGQIGYIGVVSGS